MDEIKFADLFCEIGGFRYALERANRETNAKEQGHPSQGAKGEGEGLVSQKGKGSGGKGRQYDRSDNSQPTNREYCCVWSNDNDRYACQIYRGHFGEVCEGDIRAVDTDAIPNHDLLCAGFPCQSFSIAGKRRGFEDTRGTLFFEICRVIRAKRPGYLLLENVKGLLSHDGGGTFETILRALDELGYDLQWQVLNSKNFSVPQNRERVFVVGHIRGKPRPKIFPIQETDGIYNETANAIDANYGKGWLDHGQRTMIYDPFNKKVRANQKLAGALKGEGTSETSLGTALIHTAYPDGAREYRKTSPTISTPAGGGHLPYVVSAVLTPDRAKRRQHGRRKKEPNEPMFTLTGQDIHGVEIANAVDVDGYLRFGQRPRDKDGRPQLLPIGYRRIRRLTPLECERLQGFPDGWTEGISDTQRYKCLGNAVTVNVVEAIGVRLLEELCGHGD